MKLILSSCDFLNPYSRQVIVDNLDKDISESRVLFIPNEKATTKDIISGKYHRRLHANGFTNQNNIYIFDENCPSEFCGLDIDLVYVGGGNTFATLAKLRRCAFDRELINYIKKGSTYIGGSCGAHIVSKNIEHLLELDDNYCNLKDYDALGLLDGVIVPHCGAEEYEPDKRDLVYKKLITQAKFTVYRLTNDESLIVTDKSITKLKK